MIKFTDSLLDEILSKTDFISIYKEKLRLSKKGGKWWGLCPFHAEKTPSFSVDAERGLFYCFGCQKGGSLIDFLMETEKTSFPEAVAELAERAHVRLPEPERNKADVAADNYAAQLKALNEKLATAFHWLLREHATGAEALALLRKRKIPDSFIDGFRLGYAPPDPQWLFRFLSGKGFSPEFLSKTGLFSSRNPRYPLFCDRLMFPIADSKGQVIAFGGRLLHGDGPKYINSPDTALFRKQEQLFAFDKALPEIRRTNEAIICEGYMDAISFHCAGLSNAVAPLGTAFTSRQAAILRRRCESVLLCFDSDEAGQRASERACTVATQAGLAARVMHLDGGKDASEILENLGAEALKKAVGYSINSGDFLLRRAGNLFDLGTSEGKVRAASYLFPYLDALGTEVKRDAFLDTVGKKLGLSAAALRKDYDRSRRNETGRGDDAIISSPVRDDVKRVARSADLMFTTALLLAPEYFQQIEASVQESDLEDPRAKILFRLIADAQRDGACDTTAILSRIGDEEVRRFVTSLAASGELALGINKMIDDGAKAVRIRTLEKAQVRLSSELADIFKNDDPTKDAEQVELLQKKMHLDAELARLKGEVDE